MLILKLRALSKKNNTEILVIDVLKSGCWAFTVYHSFNAPILGLTLWVVYHWKFLLWQTLVFQVKMPTSLVYQKHPVKRCNVKYEPE